MIVCLMTMRMMMCHADAGYIEQEVSHMSTANLALRTDQESDRVCDASHV